MPVSINADLAMADGIPRSTSFEMTSAALTADMTDTRRMSSTTSAPASA
jgi:hypothetical protein